MQILDIEYGIDGQWYKVDTYLGLQWTTGKNLHTPYSSM